MEVCRKSSSLFQAGFTLIELLVAIAILALLVGGAVPFAMNQLDKARRSTAKTDMQAFKGAITMYQMGMGKNPQSLKDLVKKPAKTFEEIFEFAKELEKSLKNSWLDIFFDSSGSIGRRYARSDEVGIPFCITIDGDSIKNKDVTIRHRDTTKQIRVPVKDLKNILNQLIFGEISFEKAGKLVK